MDEHNPGVSMTFYTNSHEWIKIDDQIGTIGITEHGRKELGDIVYVQLPKTETHLHAGDEAVILESTKAAADLYSPVSGKVLKVNSVLIKDLTHLNTSPESKGWLFQIELTDRGELEKLLSHESYLTLLQ